MSILTQLAQAGDYYSEYDNYTPDSAAGGAVAAVALSFFAMITFVTLIISYVVYSLLLGQIFKKAGVPQWIAWVPFYNVWKTYQLGGQQGFWTILLFVPIVNIVAAVFYYIAMYDIGLKLQKEGWFILLGIFLPIVWFAWLALDSSKWQGGTPKFAKANKPAAS